VATFLSKSADTHTNAVLTSGETHARRQATVKIIGEFLEEAKKNRGYLRSNCNIPLEIA